MFKLRDLEKVSEVRYLVKVTELNMRDLEKGSEEKRCISTTISITFTTAVRTV
jgi:hypothetical protein